MNKLVAEDVDCEFRAPVVEFEVYEMKEWDIAEHEPPKPVVSTIAARDDVSWRALIEFQGLDLVHNCRDNLDRTIVSERQKKKKKKISACSRQGDRVTKQRKAELLTWLHSR